MASPKWICDVCRRPCDTEQQALGCEGSHDLASARVTAEKWTGHRLPSLVSVTLPATDRHREVRGLYRFVERPA